MTAKHSDPEYRANARLVRQQVAHVRKFGGEVICHRCELEIEEGQAFDVGHIDERAGHGRANLSPEHRYRGDCPARGNRSHGGRLGAAITNARRGARTNARHLRWFEGVRIAASAVFFGALSHSRLRLQQQPLPLN